MKYTGMQPGSWLLSSPFSYVHKNNKKSTKIPVSFQPVILRPMSHFDPYPSTRLPCEASNARKSRSQPGEPPLEGRLLPYPDHR